MEFCQISLPAIIRGRQMLRVRMKLFGLAQPMNLRTMYLGEKSYGIVAVRKLLEAARGVKVVKVRKAIKV